MTDLSWNFVRHYNTVSTISDRCCTVELGVIAGLKQNQNTFRHLIHYCFPSVFQQSGFGWGVGIISPCWLIMTNLHIVAACEWNRVSAEKQELLPWNMGFLLPTACAAQGEPCIELVPWRYCRAVPCMSQVHTGGRLSMERILFSERTDLELWWPSVAGVTGGAQAASLSQPQVIANDFVISLHSEWTLTDMYPSSLCSWSWC